MGLTELEKYQAVNKCESDAELENAMRLISDDGLTIRGLTRVFDLQKSIKNMYAFIADKSDVIPANVLTRSYGIRQQALYLKYYNK